MKYKDIRRDAEALNKFKKFPKSIIHRKFTGTGWTNQQYTWFLELTSVSDQTMHHSNHGLYRLSYVLCGYEGEEQALPFGDQELQEQLDYKLIMYSGGIYGDDIPELIDRMMNWLESECII